MDGMTKTLFRRLLLLSVCSVGVTILLALEFGRGLLSPRELGIALLILCVAIGGGAVLIIRKSVSEHREGPKSSIDDVARKRRPMNRPRAIFAFVSGGGLLIFLSPYVIHEAAIKQIPWSVAIIVIPMYAVLSYGGFKLFWPHIVGRAGTSSQKNPTKRN
jgi:drug/metabolite transporter (DMT)-like permease